MSEVLGLGFRSPMSPSGGVLRTQKLRTPPLWQPRDIKRFFVSKPVVGQNIALLAAPADGASNCFVSAFVICSVSFSLNFSNPGSTVECVMDSKFRMLVVAANDIFFCLDLVDMTLLC